MFGSSSHSRRVAGSSAGGIPRRAPFLFFSSFLFVCPNKYLQRCIKSCWFLFFFLSPFLSVISRCAACVSV